MSVAMWSCKYKLSDLTFCCMKFQKDNNLPKIQKKMLFNWKIYFHQSNFFSYFLVITCLILNFISIYLWRHPTITNAWLFDKIKNPCANYKSLYFCRRSSVSSYHQCLLVSLQALFKLFIVDCWCSSCTVQVLVFGQDLLKNNAFFCTRTGVIM